KRVVAPFDGVVTQRTTDVGALINAGQNPGSALFRVADTHRLRIYVSVPQAYAAAIQPGLTAGLVFADRPAQRYAAAVASAARAAAWRGGAFLMRRAALLAMAVLGALSGWSLGPQAVMTLFDAGAHAAQSAAAHAAYDKQVADYRGTVLVAFQEVEDGLAAL